MSNAGPIGVGPVLQVHPSRRCNLACGHCYSSSGPQVQGELPRELLHAALKDAAALGYEQLAVSGGEPFLYDGLPGLLGRARRLDFVTSVTTNGMLLGQARRWEPVAPLIDALAISIDGTEEEHDLMRRRDGAFAQTVKNLQVVRDSGIPFGFLFTLTQYNASSLEFVVRLAASEGARSVQVHPLTLTGRAATMLQGDRPDAIELTAAIVEGRRLGEELGVTVHVDAVTQDQLTLYRGAFVPQFPTRDITDVAPVLIIESDGTVRPLTHEIPDHLAVGSLTHGRLTTLSRAWLRGPAARELAGAAERTWWDLVDPAAGPASYWYDEVAARIAPPLAPAAPVALPMLEVA
ncbi:MAG: radical SAM protein [Solirubrobacteraceae bacterium]|nr:radical SAM protein [Patulibacter sp.]